MILSEKWYREALLYEDLHRLEKEIRRGNYHVVPQFLLLLGRTGRQEDYRELLIRLVKPLAEALVEEYRRTTKVNRDLYQELQQISHFTGILTPVYFEVDEDVLQKAIREKVEGIFSEWDSSVHGFELQTYSWQIIRYKYLKGASPIDDPLVDFIGKTSFQIEVHLSGVLVVELEEATAHPDVDPDDYSNESDYFIEIRNQSLEDTEQVADRRFHEVMVSFPADNIRPTVMRSLPCYDQAPKSVEWTQFGKFFAEFSEPVQLNVFEEGNISDTRYMPDLRPRL